MTLQEELDNAQTQLEFQDAHIQQLKSELSCCQSAIDTSEHVCLGLRSQLSSYTERLSEAVTNHQTSEQQHKQTIERLQSELSDTLTQLSQAESRLTETENQRVDALSLAEERGRRCKEVQEFVGKMEDRLGDLRMSLSTLKMELEDIRGERDQLRKELSWQKSVQLEV